MTTKHITKIAGILKTAFPSAGLTESATLIRSVPGARTAGALASGTNPTTTSYPCKGFVDHEKHERVGDTLVESTDRIVCILGASLPVKPSANDKVNIDGKTQPVIDFEGTPAMWTLLLRS